MTEADAVALAPLMGLYARPYDGDVWGLTDRDNRLVPPRGGLAFKGYQYRFIYTLAEDAMLDMNPTPGAYKAQPLSPSEIDAHPDRDRLWATIMMLRVERDETTADMIDAVSQERSDELDAAQSESFESGFTEAHDTLDGVNVTYTVNADGEIAFDHNLVSSGDERDEKLLNLIRAKLDILAYRLNEEYNF